MKLYHFCIVFAAFFIGVWFLSELSISEDVYMKKVAEHNDRIFDKAVDAAVRSLRGYSEQENEYYMKEAVDSFFESLYADFNILDNPSKREELKLYVPVMAITDNEGIYVYYFDSVNTSEGFETVQRRTEKQVFSYYENQAPEGKCATDFIIRFTGPGDCRVFDTMNILGNNERYFEYHVGEDIWRGAPNVRNYYSILEDTGAFTEKRAEVMTQGLEDLLEYYCNKHNQIAELNGISYSFVLPDLDGAVYLRAFDGISFIAFFQGYPVTGTDSVFNCFTVSNARVTDN